MWKELISNIDAFLFDLDGTLIDSMGVWHDVDLKFFESLDIDLPDDYQTCVEGMSMYETAIYTKNRFGILDDAFKIIDTWNKMAFYEYSNNVKIKPNVYEILKYCKENGIGLAIATSNSRQLCEEVLRKRGIIDFFDVILTGDECLEGKPAPDVYLKAADMLNARYDRCLVFEDICRGINAGINAGMKTVAVWDEYSKESWEEKKKLADYYLYDYKEILDEIYR